MNEQYISLFQQYQAVNPLVSETEFQGYIDKYGDEYLTMVDEEIKKKIPSDQSLSGNQPSTDTIPTEITEQMNGLPMNQVDSRYEQGVTLPSDTQPQTSSESVSTLQPPSMESGLPTGQSTSEENLINATNTSTNPASEDVGNLSIPSVPIINPNVQGLGERTVRNNARLDYIADFYDQNAVTRKGNMTMTFDEIDPVEALGGTTQTSSVTEDNLTYISAREGLDAQGNPISVEQETKLYKDWKAKGYGEVYEREGKPVFATNEKGRKELAPLYQTQTEPVAPTPEEAPTPLNSFLDELSLYGAVPTDEERAQMVDTDYREEYLLSTQAAYWAKENGTAFQEEYDRLNTGAKYDDSQKVKIAATILDVLNEGIEREGDSADTQEERNYYNAIRQNPQVLADFGDYLAKNGMDDISFVRGRSFTSQKNRKRLIDEYTNFRLEKEQITMEAAEQSAKASEARLPLFERSGDSEGYNAEVARINGFKDTYNQAATRAKQIQDNYANVQPIFKKINRQNEELADFTVKIENNEVGANTVNILGQFPLVVGQKVTSLIGGVGRIANAVIGSENFRDALDIMATEEIKIGNVTAGKIANRVEYFKDANGAEYKEINGTLYSYDNGKIRRLKGDVDRSQLKSQSKDTEYNFTGVVNMTTGLLADALLTRGTMSGLSRGAKFTDYAAKSKRVGEFFGANSQIAKGMSSLSTVMKNPSAANFAYWNTQFMQDSYIAAKEGGITSETGRYIYAISQSVGLATISQINPDINILKAMGNSNRSLVNALLRNDIPAAQKAFGAIMDYGKKAGINVAKEVPEELLQQGYQDFSAMLVNEMADKNIKVAEVQDYKELAVGTIGSVALAAAFGGRANVNIGGNNVDVNNMTQPEILTLLARTPNGLEQLKSAKEDVYFESQRTLTDTLIKDVETRKKYLDKIPDIEKYSVAKLSEVVPVMQELERKREQLKNDDGTFSETLNNEINSLTSQVNSILAGQPEVQNTQETPLQNEETAQSTPESETVQEQTSVTDNEPEQIPTTANEESGVINEEQQPETTTESNEGAVATEQNILPDVEDDIELDENELNRLVGILNEAAQGNNTGTNGDVQLGTDSVQQQGQVQEVRETADSTGGQKNTEVKVKPFKKGDGGTKGIFTDSDGKTYKSIIPLSRRIENNQVVFDEQTPNEKEFEALSKNQDLKHLPRVGKMVETSEGKAFEIEKLNEVEKGTLTLDELKQVEDTLSELNKRNIFVNDINSVMRRDNGDIVLIDLSNSSEAFEGETERISQNVVELLPLNEQSKYNAYERSRYINSQKELFEVSERENYTYFLTQRPPSIGTHPLGQIRDAESVTVNGREVYKLTYQNPLSKEEIKKYELTEVLDESDAGRIFSRGNIHIVIDNINSDKDLAITTFVGDKEKRETISHRQFAKVTEGFTEVTQQAAQQTPAFSDNEQAQTLNINQYERNGKVYTRQDDGSFTSENKNGVQQKTTNKATVAELNNLATQRREESITEIKENNGYTYKQYADGEQVITSPEGKEIKSHTTRTVTVNGKTTTRKVRNGNFFKQRAKIFGEKTDNEIAEENRKRNNEALKNFTPTNERDLALLYFANGGKISPASAKKELAGTNARLEARGKKRTITEYSWVWLGEDAKDSFEAVSEKIAQNQVQDFDQQTLRNELIDVAREYGSRGEVTQEIVDRYNDEVDPNMGFTDEEIAERELAEMSEAKKQFLDSVGDVYGMEDDQLLEYYKEQYKNSLNSLTDEQQDEIYSDSERTSAQSGSQNQSNEVSNSGEQEINFQRTEPSAQSLPQPVLEGLIEKLKKPFKKAFKNLNVVYDWKSFAEKAKAMGIDNMDMQRMVMAFHGSPNSFDRFSTEFMGTGEGAQAFGWGLYFTDLKSIAEQYTTLGGYELSGDIEGYSEEDIVFAEEILATYIRDMPFDDVLKQIKIVRDGYTSGLNAKDKERYYKWNKALSILSNKNVKYKNKGALYTVNLHQGKTPEQYTWLEWDKTLSEKALDVFEIFKNERGLVSTREEDAKKYTYELYTAIARRIGAKNASLFLLENGIDGIKYPAESISRGATSDNARGFNYVVFDDQAVTIVDKVQFMHDTQGEIYGAVLPDGTIYLNPDRFNANTAIHEFTHLWEQIMPNAWKKGVELFKNTQTGKNIFNQLKEEGNYSNLNEEQLWSEALNTHLGNYGGENWQNIRAQSNMDKLRDWFRDFIAKIGEATGLNSYFGAPLTPETKLDRFTKGVMQDLLNGKTLNPESSFEATEVPVVIKQMSDSDLETMLTDLGVIQQGKCA